MSLADDCYLGIKTSALDAVSNLADESIEALFTAIRAAVIDGASFAFVALETDLSIVLVEKAACIEGRSGRTGWLLLFDN